MLQAGHALPLIRNEASELIIIKKPEGTDGFHIYDEFMIQDLFFPAFPFLSL